MKRQRMEFIQKKKKQLPPPTFTFQVLFSESSCPQNVKTRCAVDAGTTRTESPASSHGRAGEPGAQNRR